MILNQYCKVKNVLIRFYLENKSALSGMKLNLLRNVAPRSRGETSKGFPVSSAPVKI